MQKKKLNIALVHLSSNGDILYATVIAKQIKEIDFPNSNLTWIVSSSCSKTLENNPYIDNIIEIKSTREESSSNIWDIVKKDILDKKKQGIYDEVFFTQIHPDNWHNFDETIRKSILNNYPFKIKSPNSPIVLLNQEEINNVKSFVKDNNITNYKNIILFECSPKSGQSFITLDLAKIISEKIIINNQSTCIILSSPYSIDNYMTNIIDGSKLTFRENAELIKYCTLLIGCSSGITWISTSTAGKKLPMLQLLKKNSESIFASVEYDFKLLKEDTNHIIEITNENVNYIVNCINTILNYSFAEAKKQFGESLEPNHSIDFYNIVSRLLKQGKVKSTIKFILSYKKQRKINLKLLIITINRIFKIIKLKSKLK